MSYYIVEHDGIAHQIIDKTGKPNKYGEPKIFETKTDAEKWINKRSYKYMAHSYEIKEV